MMKKNGFTLAEVLITLAIIGVVATLTLPALMTNTGEQQAVAGFKKGLNTLTEAAQMNSALEGFDYSGLLGSTKTTEENGNAVQSLYGLITSRASVDAKNSGTGKGWKQNGSTSSNYVIYFRDGACLSFIDTTTSTQITQLGTASNTYGVKAVYDINGNKGPNVLSNCNKSTSGNSGKDATQSGTGTLADFCNKTNRVIKDQFGVVLSGNRAIPNGPAARWTAEQ